MKVFLDTNVVVSATATRGLCADVFRSVIEFHELVISESLLAEVERVLRDKFRAPADLITETIWLLRQDALLASADPKAHISVKDKTDIAILSAAINGKADMLITGDRELLDLGTAGNVEILSPRQFWDKITSREGT